MGYLNEYLNKNLEPNKLFDELQSLMKSYKENTGREIFLYVAAMFKNIPGISMDQEDFYVFRDMLSNYSNEDEIDIYIETPGGNGTAAEEIARFLHNKFKKVNFLISGEAKSAGTILVMSGNEIYMTETGSLGPIDAQVPIGRSVVSAYDYMDWIDKKKEEADEHGNLNPVDAIMISQITPGELQQVFNSLEFAKDLVKEWLPKYKFHDWNVTETHKEKVTQEKKMNRASDIATKIADHSRWREHGRSLKIGDLTSIGLKVVNLDSIPNIAEIIYRIQFVCKSIFGLTTIYKLFVSKNEKIFKNVINADITNESLPNYIGAPQVLQINVKCNKCGRNHAFYKELINGDKSLADDMKRNNIKNLPDEDKYKCECGNILDLKAIKNEIAIKFYNQ